MNNTFAACLGRKLEAGKQVRLFNSHQAQYPSGVIPAQSLYSFSMCFQICLFLSKRKKISRLRRIKMEALITDQNRSLLYIDAVLEKTMIDM